MVQKNTKKQTKYDGGHGIGRVLTIAKHDGGRGIGRVVTIAKHDGGHGIGSVVTIEATFHNAGFQLTF